MLMKKQQHKPSKLTWEGPRSFRQVVAKHVPGASRVSTSLSPQHNLETQALGVCGTHCAGGDVRLGGKGARAAGRRRSELDLLPEAAEPTGTTQLVFALGHHCQLALPLRLAGLASVSSGSRLPFQHLFPSSQVRWHPALQLHAAQRVVLGPTALASPGSQLEWRPETQALPRSAESESAF